jgi:hypothetical protein
LLDELRNVRLRETTTPNVYRLDHDSSRHDDRAIALALGVLHFVEIRASGAQEWLESLVQEAQPAPVTGPRTAQLQPPGWLSAPIPDRLAPTPETANALRMLEYARQYGNMPQQFNRF